MWRKELERQDASLGVKNVFDSMLVHMGEKDRELSELEILSDGYKRNWEYCVAELNKEE